VDGGCEAADPLREVGEGAVERGRCAAADGVGDRPVRVAGPLLVGRVADGDDEVARAEHVVGVAGGDRLQRDAVAPRGGDLGFPVNR